MRVKAVSVRIVAVVATWVTLAAAATTVVVPIVVPIIVAACLAAVLAVLSATLLLPVQEIVSVKIL